MERKIKITAGNVTAEAHLFTTATADAIWNGLPFESTCNLWGDEIYFTIPLSQSLEKDAREIVGKGDLGYWPQGPAFCIFFGRTPASRADEIRPASPVNIIGKITEDAKEFRKVKSGSQITIEALEQK